MSPALAGAREPFIATCAACRLPSGDRAISREVSSCTDPSAGASFSPRLAFAGVSSWPAPAFRPCRPSPPSDRSDRAATRSSSRSRCPAASLANLDLTFETVTHLNLVNLGVSARLVSPLDAALLARLPANVSDPRRVSRSSCKDRADRRRRARLHGDREPRDGEPHAPADPEPPALASPWGGASPT